MLMIVFTCGKISETQSLDIIIIINLKSASMTENDKHFFGFSE